MSYKPLVFIFILFQTGLISAQSSISEHVSIDWLGDAARRTSSDVSELPEHIFPCLEFKGLPAYFFRAELDRTYGSADVQLTNQIFQPISSGKFTREQLKVLTSGVQTMCRVSQGRLDYYDNLVVLPYRKNTSTGQIEQLVEFTFTIQNRAGGGGRSASRAASQSVLSEGEWYKIAIDRDGVYRINKDVLSDLGIDVNSLVPNAINIYGNGGHQLPFENGEFRYDDLERNSIFVSSTGNSFAANDYILFYGQGADSWDLIEGDVPEDMDRFVHLNHHYSDSAYYYIRVDDVDPERITELTVSSETPDHISTQFQERLFHEKDISNLVKSGREFYGEIFDVTTSQVFNFSADNSLPIEGIAEVKMVARSSTDPSNTAISLEGSSADLPITNVGSSAVSPVALVGTIQIPFTPDGDGIEVSIDFEQPDPSAQAWLDYIQLNFYRGLTMVGSQMHFRDPESIGVGVNRFDLANASNVDMVWDVTDATNVKNVPFSLDGETVSFAVNTDDLREFVAFRNSNFLTPRTVGPVSNQNLHALEDVDMIVLSSPLLVTAAERMAELHRADGMVVEVVTPMQVYNEFSSGNPDVTAVKMLMKSLYDKADGEEDLLPQYLCLFGDGDYSANKGVNNINSTNVIAFYSAESLSPTNSVVSDDYFGLLGDDEGEFISSLDMLDIGIGRIPAEGLAEANAYIDKLTSYMSDNTSSNGDSYCLGDENGNPYGSWRNDIVFVSDDQDGSSGPGESVHMASSDSFSDSIYFNHNDFNVEKIYMDAYLQESTPGGERYPEGAEALRRKVEKGALVVNYIGHGGEKGWAHERILTIPTIQGWGNFNQLPVFMTATCELSRYDDPAFKSAGELIMMNPNGGAIAMLTTTRIVYSNSNFSLGKAFYDVAFDDKGSKGIALGDIARMTKNATNVAGNANSRNFSLLGDPAMKMAYPEFKVFTTELNGEPIAAEMDTLKSLQEVSFSGYVGMEDGTIMEDFNGFVYPTVFDKKSDVTVQNNDGGINYSFDVFQNVIYRGKASVENGLFTFSFVVPRDINYNVDVARVSYYAVAGNRDAHGHFEAFKIGGAVDGAELNTVGPEIKLFLNDSTFVFGGLTDESPILFAKVFDENGINTVGNGIGHDIAATLDGQTNDQIVLNEFYESDLNTFKSGELRYQLDGLSDGTHNLSLKVWDVHNNSSLSYTEFVVAASAELALDHVLNYPNPFTTRTEFFFEHNQVCDVLEVQIQVFTVAGKIVKTIHNTIESNGFRSDGVVWDGKDDFGDKIGRGVYVYRVQVKTPDGQKAEEFEKLVILN
ncbi:MAG: hypothetical protein ACI84C_000258 [Flavobacteriales bacterium]|jgi:hypothetical protein